MKRGPRHAGPGRARAIGALLVAAGVALLAFSLPVMARRLHAYNARADFQRFAFQRINEERFAFLALPVAVTLDPAASGAPAVRIDWRGESVSIPVAGHTERRLPGLLKVDDWLQVLEMRALERGPAGVAPAREGSRVIVVSRRPAPDDNDGKFVNRKGWVYDLVELRRPDAAAESALPEPKPDVREGRVDPSPLVSEFTQSDAFARWTINFAALPNYERTWQYAAALAVTPTLSYPRNKFTDDGLAAMAWTWPVAGLGIVAGMAGAIVLAASLVRAPTQGMLAGPPLA